MIAFASVAAAVVVGLGGALVVAACMVLAVLGLWLASVVTGR